MAMTTMPARTASSVAPAKQLAFQLRVFPCSVDLASATSAEGKGSPKSVEKLTMNSTMYLIEGLFYWVVEDDEVVVGASLLLTSAANVAIATASVIPQPTMDKTVASRVA